MPGSEKALIEEAIIEIDEKQLRMAAKAIKAYLGRCSRDGKEQLFDNDGFISLHIHLVKAPEKDNMNPLRIPIVNSLYHQDNCEICLFTSDPQRDYKEKLAKKPVDGISKVMGLKKLRSNFSRYIEKRQLCKAYDLFLADERIVGALPSLIGKWFYKAKKQPVLVDLTKSDFTKALTTARDSTYFFISTGRTCTIKIARESFSVDQIVDNVLHSIQSVVQRVPGKVNNIQEISLKSCSSLRLPFYNVLPPAPSDSN